MSRCRESRMRQARTALVAMALALLGATAAWAQNPIVTENLLPGNPSSQWDVTGAGSLAIQGFATDISHAPGDVVQFKVDTSSTDYRLDVYRMGYYGGNGARLVATVQPSAPLPQTQPPCLTDPPTGLVDCGNWAVSASWAIPGPAVSGIYFAKLIREDVGGPEQASHVAFVVRDDTGGSDVLVQTADTTWQAYNDYGGNSLYEGSPAGRAYRVSYNRPFDSRAETPEDWMFNAEYPLVRWLERNGYDVSYTTGVDTDRRGGELLEHGVFVSVGHDEYWSNQQRANIEAARDAGVHLAFMSGNEVFWKTRWESSIDGSGTPYRTLTCYKETHANAKIDPLPGIWTGTWRDPRFSPPADGNRPENGLTGTIFTVNCCTYDITVPAADGKMRFWRNTSVATLPPAATATLTPNSLGYEWDEDLDNGARPPGLVRLSTTTVSVPQRVLDFGSNYGPGTATHRLTLHRRGPGDALTFGAGTIQWVWGLDGNHDRGASTEDARMQQATVNLFADMGVQPTTLQGGLVATTASADAIPPTAAIASPPNASFVVSGDTVTISGTAADAGGGVVGGVEVSVDGGATWHPATGPGLTGTGRESWTYQWTVPAGAGAVTLRARAVDDSGNLESPGASVTVTRGALGSLCGAASSLIETTTADFADGTTSNVVVVADGDGALRLTSGATSGTYTSSVLDSGSLSSDLLTFNSVLDTPAGTSVSVETRTGNALPAGGPGWSPFQALSGTTIASPNGRYVQYRATLTAPNGSITPVVRAIVICFQACVPTGESCDGVDNNCNGQVDETFPDLGSPCTAGVGACQAAGVRVCAPGGASTQCNAVPGTPSTELCNGIDDDCDGTADDGFPLGSACTAGVGACERPGSLVCAPGGLGTQCNATPGTPSTETCNGVDDDCDGTADDGNPGGGTACTTGLPGACAAGTFQCQGGSLVCVASASSPEVCDGQDNDCDGTADDGNPGGGGACTTGQPGVCAAGTQQCQAGSLACLPTSAPGTELCATGADENCDGQTDEAACALCVPASTVVGDTQTRRTTVRLSAQSNADRVQTRGTFVLPAAGVIAPATEALMVEITDGSGVHYRGVLPAGSLVPSANGRTFRYADAAAAVAGVRLMRLAIRGDGVTVKYVFKVQAVNSPSLAAGTGTATLRIGGRCFTDDQDACVVSASGLSGSCK